MRKIVLAGGSGYLGKVLSQHFLSSCDEIVVLSRHAKTSEGKIKFIKWDGVQQGEWTKELNGAEAIINLSGRSINCRFNETNKKEILESRVKSTQAIGEAIQKLNLPPKVWINFSAAAVYQNAVGGQHDESSQSEGSGFMFEVCKQWEQAVNSFQLPQTRQIILRISMVLGKSGGVVSTLLPLVKLGLGGAAGSGRQMVSWIHEKDVCRLTEWLINTPEANGVYHAASQNPVTNSDMMKAFRKACKMPIGFPAPTPAVKLGALFMGTEASLVLDSVNIIPRKSLSGGFVFEFPEIEEALSNLIGTSN